jgi:DNA-binding Lrp family transcriptional regulator
MRRTRRAQLDQLDVEILQRYQQNTQTPAHSIGKAVGLSAAAVQRRLKSMRESGVIAREAAELDPSALGLTVTCIVNVQLVSDAAPQLARFRKLVASTAEVQQAYYVTGSSDYVLIVVMADMQDYEAFTNGPLLTDANVRKFTTQVVLSRIKVGLDVCLEGRVTKA